MTMIYLGVLTFPRDPWVQLVQGMITYDNNPSTSGLAPNTIFDYFLSKHLQTSTVSKHTWEAL